jgi:hypothetical protein
VLCCDQTSWNVVTCSLLYVEASKSQVDTVAWYSLKLVRVKLILLYGNNGMHYFILVNISHSLKRTGIGAMSAWDNRWNTNGICAAHCSQTVQTTANENATNVAADQKMWRSLNEIQELRLSHISNLEVLLDIYWIHTTVHRIHTSFQMIFLNV